MLLSVHGDQACPCLRGLTCYFLLNVVLGEEARGSGRRKSLLFSFECCLLHQLLLPLQTLQPLLALMPCYFLLNVVPVNQHRGLLWAAAKRYVLPRLAIFFWMLYIDDCGPKYYVTLVKLAIFFWMLFLYGNVIGLFAGTAVYLLLLFSFECCRSDTRTPLLLRLLINACYFLLNVVGSDSCECAGSDTLACYFLLNVVILIVKRNVDFRRACNLLFSFECCGDDDGVVLSWHCYLSLLFSFECCQQTCTCCASCQQTRCSCYFLLNVVGQLCRSDVASRRWTFLLFSFECCLSAQLLGWLQPWRFTCYFLLNVVRWDA